MAGFKKSLLKRLTDDQKTFIIAQGTTDAWLRKQRGYSKRDDEWWALFRKRCEALFAAKN